MRPSTIMEAQFPFILWVVKRFSTKGSLGSEEIYPKRRFDVSSALRLVIDVEMIAAEPKIGQAVDNCDAPDEPGCLSVWDKRIGKHGNIGISLHGYALSVRRWAGMQVASNSSRTVGG